MNFTKLNLDEIQEEIIEECFNTNPKTITEIVDSTCADDFLIDISDAIISPEIVEEEFVLKNISNPEISKSTSKQKKISTYQNCSNEVLVKHVQSGNDTEICKELLIVRNSGLVYTEAKKCTCNIPFQDKVQYGFEGLLKAIYNFNTNFKTQFSTYATMTIKNFMYRNGNMDARLIALPEYLSVDNIKVQSFINNYISQNQRIPNISTIVSCTGISTSNVTKIMHNFSNFSISIDTPVYSGEDSNDRTLQDVLTSDEGNYQLDEKVLSMNFNDFIDEIAKHLTEAERKLVGMVYGCFDYKVLSFEEIIRAGYVDVNGKKITSKPTLSRRLDDVTQKIKRIIERENISF